jgi:hypothetical protein
MGVGSDLVKKIYKTDPDLPFEFPLSRATLPKVAYDKSNNGNQRLVELTDTANVFLLSGLAGTPKTRIWWKNPSHLSYHKITNSAQASGRGFMSSSQRDLGSVEIHLYFKHLEGEGDYYIGGPTGEEGPNKCSGAQYQSCISINGDVCLQKRQWYPSGVTPPSIKTITSPIVDRWIGLKLCILIMGPNRVRIEQYVDLGDVTNNWRLTNRILDQSDWGDQGAACGSSLPGQAIDRAAPNVTILGTMGGNVFQLKKAMVRSVIDQRDDHSVNAPSLGIGAKQVRITQPPKDPIWWTNEDDDWEDPP